MECGGNLLAQLLTFLAHNAGPCPAIPRTNEIHEAFGHAMVSLSSMSICFINHFGSPGGTSTEFSWKGPTMSPEKMEAAAGNNIHGQDDVVRPAAARPHQRYAKTDLAATCLARVLAEYGLPGSPAEVHKHLNASLCRDDVINFLDVAEKFGLDGHPVVLTSAEWQDIPSGSILHWGPDHLVVFESYCGDLAIVHDPVLGTRQVEMAEFRRQFTGVVLRFESVTRGRG